MTTNQELWPDDLRAYALEHFSFDKASHVCRIATTWESQLAEAKARIAELEAISRELKTHMRDPNRCVTRMGIRDNNEVRGLLKRLFESLENGH